VIDVHYYVGCFLLSCRIKSRLLATKCHLGG